MSRRSIVSALRGETDKHILRILDVKAGDLTFEWEPDDGGGVALAEREFDAAKEKGLDAYATTGEASTIIKEFDPEADTIVMAPRINGG
jgi:hypothetical protein